MTQRELLQKIEEAFSAGYVSYTPQQRILDIINNHVKEVIGEKPKGGRGPLKSKNPLKEILRDKEYTTRLKIYNEQMKKADLERG